MKRYCQDRNCLTVLTKENEKIGIWTCPNCGKKYCIIDNLCGRYYTELK